MLAPMLFNENRFKFSEFEFEFCWHSCYFRKKGKVQIFLLRIKIRILLAPMLFLEKRKSSNFLTSNSNSNFASTHVILGNNENLKFSVYQFEFKFSWHPCYFWKKVNVQIFLLRIRIRILLVDMFFMKKAKVIIISIRIRIRILLALMLF